MLLLLKVYPRIYIYFLCGKEYWTKKSQDINCLLSISPHLLQPHGQPLGLMFLLKQSKVKFIFYDDYLFYKAISQAVSKYWSIPSTSHPPTSHSIEQGFKVQFQYGQIILLPLISQGYPESHQQVLYRGQLAKLSNTPPRICSRKRRRNEWLEAVKLWWH